MEEPHVMLCTLAAGVRGVCVRVGPGVCSTENHPFHLVGKISMFEWTS